MAWLCNCGIVNGGTNKECGAARQAQFAWARVEHYQVSENSPDWIMAFMAAKELGMTPDEELFAKFYNHEKLLVKDMDHIQFQEHVAELEKISFEAKARLVAAREEGKERKNKTTKKEWLVTPNPNVTVSDAINVPKVRAGRMSKMDRLKQQLEKANLDPQTIKEMLAKMEQRATDSKLKTVTFKVPTVELGAVQVQPAKEVKAFDPSSLRFECKVCKQNPCRCDGLTPVLAK